MTSATGIVSTDSVEYPVGKFSDAAHISSRITPAALNHFWEVYHIPLSVELVAPDDQWRACSPPVGYDTIYTK